MLENDLVEAIIGLPTDMFYNTGVSTYVWIVSNRKPVARKDKVQHRRCERLLPENTQR
jgi:type I restriction enzyme M protein